MTTLDAIVHDEEVNGGDRDLIVREQFFMLTDTLKVWLRKDIAKSVLRKVCRDLRSGNELRSEYHVDVDYKARVITARELLGTKVNGFVVWLRASLRKFMTQRKQSARINSLSEVEHDKTHPSVTHNRRQPYINAPKRSKQQRRALALVRAA